MSGLLHPFFEQLDPLIAAPIFIPERCDELAQEIRENCVYVSIPSEIAKEITIADFIAFLELIKTDRRLQLACSTVNTELLYYSWHDEQAGQFRFNFIRADHGQLPVNAPVRLIDDESIIVASFLKSQYLDGIPWSELRTSTIVENDPEPLLVFQELIPRQTS